MSHGAFSKRPYSLRNQLTMLVAALGIPLLLLQAFWSWHGVRDARVRAEMDALAFADASGLGVRQFFDNAEELLTTSAGELGPGFMDNPATCAQWMGLMHRVFPFLHNAVAIRADGSVACSVLPNSGDDSAVDWLWWDGVVANPVFTLGDPVEGSYSRTWILPMIAPIVDEAGGFGGAVVGTVSLVDLSTHFGGVNLPASHLVTVATADRIVVSRSHDAERYVGQPLPPETGTDRMTGPNRWVASGPDLAGVPRTWGQIEIPPGWVVYVGVPDSVVYGPAMVEAFQRMGATLIIVILGFLLAGRAHQRIARAFKELAGRTRATSSGEIVPALPDTPVEVAQVVEQFNETLRARDRAEASERKARERFQSIFDNAVFGLYVSTLDGQFLQVNEALSSMLAYETPEALMDAGPAALYVDPRQRRELIESSIGAKRIEPREIDWLRADGVPLVVRIGGKVIAGPDGDPVFEMIVQDITEEKRTEDELRQTQKMEAIGQLAGGIAHDFNNLLTVIGGNVELLENDAPDDERIRADLTQISRATQRATSLTRRLLTFSRKERRGEQTLDVNEVVPELGKLLVPLIGEDMTLITELGPGPLPISIDPGELEQVVLNLVLNSRDAMPRGGQIVIATSAAHGPDREGDSRRGTEGVLLTVSDTGVGMDEATRRRVFEPFYTTKPMGEGTGLGLSTVYGIVHRAGGRIDLDSEPGSGTRMNLWFPAAERPLDSDDDQTAEPRGMVGGSESVLVVEDDELVGSFVLRALTEAGYAVRLATGGEEALAALEERSADLVLTDVVMKGMSGPELADRLSVIAPGTPVLFMSGYFDNAYLSAELAEHPEGLLRKPFTTNELRDRVRRILDRTRVARPV